MTLGQLYDLFMSLTDAKVAVANAEALLEGCHSDIAHQGLVDRLVAAEDRLAQLRKQRIQL